MASTRSTPAFLGSRLARRLFALFVLAALAPLALSDWVSMSAMAEIADTLSLRDRTQATRQTSRQVLDRLITAKALLAASPAVPPPMETAPGAGAPPATARVFRSLTHLRPDGSAAWSTSPSIDLAHAWAAGDSGLNAAKPPGAAGKGEGKGDAIQITLRTHAPPGQAPRLLLGARQQGLLRWVAELNPAYLWAPLADASEDSAWSVLDARGRALTRFEGSDHPSAAAQAGSGKGLIESRSSLFLGGEFEAGDWVFLQRAPRPQVRWQGALLTVWLSLVAAGTLLVVALLSQWQIRRTLSPLEQLAEGTRRLAAGARDARVPVGRDDEIGALAEAFNVMATHIEVQFDALEGLAAIDQDILAGAPIERLAERVLQQLAVLYPGTPATVSWLDGETGLLQAGLQPAAGAPPTFAIERIALSPAQLHAYRQLAQDGPVDPLSGSTTVQLPLRLQEHTQALITLASPTPLAREQWLAACELRDRLAVAFSARAREQDLVYRATHDSLTGLANRYGLHAQLDQLMQAQHGAPARAAVLVIDLDHFKDVNDTRGHEAGDALLRQASARLQACAPAPALVARPGGDEFVILLPGADEALTRTVALDAIQRLSQPFALGSDAHVLGASVGIALCPDHGQTREELLRCADIALYAAKASGRGRHTVFTGALDDAARERVQLQAELRAALEHSEFVVHYQPRVRPADGAITSAEALIRWQRPGCELLFPDAFVGLAESSGLIDRIGLWVLDTTCAQIAAWRQQGLHLERVSVNVSPRQLISGELPGQVRAALDRHALPAELLELEVTESLLLGDVDNACSQLALLRSWGVSIALDDFGTGYSSMATLHQLPLDVMKIDRSFVTHLGSDSSTQAVVGAIVALARALGLHLVAEGVETETQASILRSKGCDELQGYLYSRPVPAAQFAGLPGLRRHAYS